LLILLLKDSKWFCRYQTENLYWFEDELPVLIPIGNKVYFEINGDKMMFEVVEYDIQKVDDEDPQFIVYCHEVESDIDMDAIVRDLKIKSVFNEDPDDMWLDEEKDI
jgi:hypothetical protein